MAGGRGISPELVDEHPGDGRLEYALNPPGSTIGCIQGHIRFPRRRSRMTLRLPGRRFLPGNVMDIFIVHKIYRRNN